MTIWLAVAALASDGVLVLAQTDYTHWPDPPAAAAAGSWATQLGQPDAVKRDLTAQAMATAVRAAVQGLEPGARLWVVYLGHGAWSVSGERLLVGVDAPLEADRTDNHALTVGDLRRVLATVEGGVLVIDAGFGPVGVDGATLPVRAPPEALELAPAPGWVEWWADARPGPRTPFSPLALGAMRGWADADGDGLVGPEEAQTLVQAGAGAFPGIAGSTMVGDSAAWPKLRGSESAPARQVVQTFDPDAWIAGGTGFYREGEQRFVRGVARATGHRFLMDAKKAGRAQAQAQLHVAVSELIRATADEAARAGLAAHSVAEIRASHALFVSLRGRLFEGMDGEHLAWQGRPDDSFVAMFQIPLADYRTFAVDHADLGPDASSFITEHLDRVFDGL